MISLRMESDMKMNNPNRTLVFAAMGVLLAGCATMEPAQSEAGQKTSETISYSVGPCFGFCPVYQVEITPSGHVTYTGERHTTLVGVAERESGSGAYKAAASALAAYRPADGMTAQTQCDQRMSDQQNYRITWKKADGTQTVLEHDKGCRSVRNDELNKVLEGLPTKLGIADWAKQKTEAGASRG
jgi:hypothetical protein